MVFQSPMKPWENKELGSLIRHERQRLGMSASQLATEVGLKTRQHVSGIEKGKCPSLEVLASIVRFLSKTSGDQESVKKETILRLATAAFGIAPEDLATGLDPTRLHEEVLFQNTLQPGDQIWILTDTFAELLDPKLLDQTIGNIRDRNISFTYFVPLGSFEWEGLLAALAHSISETELEQRLRIISISPLAFACRIRIANPGTNRQHAVYGLRVEGGSEFLFYPAPVDLVRAWIKTLCSLVSSLTGVGVSTQRQLCVEKALSAKLGEARLLFPTSPINKNI